MIKVDEQAYEKSVNKWRTMLFVKHKVLGLSIVDCVKVESGRLVQWLIKLAPPKDKNKLAKKIRKDVFGKFFLLSDWRNGHQADLHWAKAGDTNSDVHWYAFQSDAIFGVAKDYDLTNASAQGLYDVYKNTELNSKGRIVAGQRGRQTVYLWQRYVVDPKTVQGVIKMVQKLIGRLKSGWLPAYEALGSPQGAYTPPQWVIAHEGTASQRGWANAAGLSDKDKPTFILENHAAGIGSNFSRSQAKKAMDIRFSAMAGRILQIMKHPERAREEIAKPDPQDAGL